MPGLKAVLLNVPPLLADIIRQALTGRAEVQVVAELADPGPDGAAVRVYAPDIVILREAAGAPADHAARLRALLPDATVLVVSSDLTRLDGPGAGDARELTLAALHAAVVRLRRSPGGTASRGR